MLIEHVRDLYIAQKKVRYVRDLHDSIGKGEICEGFT
jgi:hypothetical protein